MQFSVYRQSWLTALPWNELVCFELNICASCCIWQSNVSVIDNVTVNICCYVGTTVGRSFATLMLMFIINVAIKLEVCLLYSFVLHVFYPSFFICGKFRCHIPYIHFHASKMQSFRFLQPCNRNFHSSEIQHCVAG